MIQREKIWKNIRHPAGILLFISLPQSVLIGFFQFLYSSIMNEPNSGYFLLFYVFQAVLVILSLCCFIYLWMKKKKVPLPASLITIPVYLIYAGVFVFSLFVYFHFYIEGFPISEFIFYFLALIFPGIFYCLALIVYYLSEKNKMQKYYLDIMGLCFIPLGYFLFFRVILPMGFYPYANGIFIHILIIFIITTIVLFGFFLLRILFMFMKKEKPGIFKWIWKTVVLILLPVAAFLIYHAYFTNPYGFENIQLLDHINHPLYYLMLACTGLLLFLPRIRNRYFTLIIFCLMLILLPFTLYFFLFLLPLAPMALTGMLNYGLALLILYHIIIFFVHVHSLIRLYRDLTDSFHPRFILISFFCILILPSIVTVNYFIEKQILTKAIDYVFYPEPGNNREFSIDTQRLEGILHELVLSSYITGYTNYSFSFDTMPVLSYLFRLIVLENRSLTRESIDRLFTVFIDPEGSSYNDSIITGSFTDNSSSFPSTEITTHTEYDYERQCWKSRIDIDITNGPLDLNEYRTQVEIPAGCFISDFYLMIEDRKKKGLIVNKEASLWIYHEIVNKSRDPGILYYLENGLLALHVFPFSPDETRYTGFEILHLEPVTITIAGQEFRLGEVIPEGNVLYVSSDNKVVYLPSGIKNSLSSFNRKPYYHFILDYSNYSITGVDNKESYEVQIQEILNKGLIRPHKAVVSLVNYSVHTMSLEDYRQKAIFQYPCEGGFFLERALESIFLENFNSNIEYYPIIIVLSPSSSHFYISDSFSDFSFTHPESDNFYWYSKEGSFYRFSYLDAERGIMVEDNKLSAKYTVLAWPDIHKPFAYLRDDGLPSIIYLDNEVETLFTYNYNERSLLDYYSFYRNYRINPEKTGKYGLFDFSLKENILTPITSFICLETEEDKQRLLQKQKEILIKDDNQFNPKDYHSASEPDFILLILLLLAIILLKYLFRRHSYTG